MIVEILVFARLKELLNSERISVHLDDGANVATLKAELARLHPQVANLLLHCGVAVDQEYATNDMILVEGSEIGLIPPVSGG